MCKLSSPWMKRKKNSPANLFAEEKKPVTATADVWKELHSLWDIFCHLGWVFKVWNKMKIDFSFAYIYKQFWQRKSTFTVPLILSSCESYHFCFGGMETWSFYFLTLLPRSSSFPDGWLWYFPGKDNGILYLLPGPIPHPRWFLSFL